MFWSTMSTFADAKVDRIFVGESPEVSPCCLFPRHKLLEGSFSSLQQAPDLLFEDCDISRACVLAVDTSVAPYEEDDR